MANRSRSSSRQYFSPEWFPPGVKWLLIINVSIFLILFFSTRFTGAGRWYSGFQLQPASVVRVGAIWQLVTYCFLHSEPLEFFWNGLYLYWLGTMLEPLWGTKRFLQFYFSCAVGGAVVAIIGTYLFYDPKTPFREGLEAYVAWLRRG